VAHIKENKMKRKLLFALLLLTVGSVKTQVVYSVGSSYNADVKVFVVNSRFNADLLVYRLDNSFNAQGNRGFWYFTDTVYNAKKKIYFVDSSYNADLKIFFVYSKSNAGWKKSSKKHLMY